MKVREWQTLYSEYSVGSADAGGVADAVEHVTLRSRPCTASPLKLTQMPLKLTQMLLKLTQMPLKLRQMPLKLRQMLLSLQFVNAGEGGA